MIAVGGYGLALVAVGLAPVAFLGAVALLAAGAGYLGISSTLNTTIQLQVTEAMRGKVLALYVMVLTLAMPLGSLLQGWLVDVVGVQARIVGAGVLVFIGANAHLVHVALSSQPDCVEHLKTQGRDGAYRAAGPAC